MSEIDDPSVAWIMSRANLYNLLNAKWSSERDEILNWGWQNISNSKQLFLRIECENVSNLYLNSRFKAFCFLNLFVLPFNKKSDDAFVTKNIFKTRSFIFFARKNSVSL